ncbi:hypothetical protein PAXINDRAFT_19791 [Paxillus involutus ATCC 200175]|uniref:Uncharacterized protein n=1 Tax=Paxillus involutus ATCC 200175 TaxID=664439 RepID=A0A0C9SW70_PAXIN|nr:hypothetical protein PAXINDRAFT_19791 [Paxillus involutus ATCC 200175]
MTNQSPFIIPGLCHQPRRGGLVPQIPSTSNALGNKHLNPHTPNTCTIPSLAPLRRLVTVRIGKSIIPVIRRIRHSRHTSEPSYDTVPLLCFIFICSCHD